MNLIELLLFLAMIAIGGALAWVLYPVGGLWLAVPGFLVGLLLIPSIFFTYHCYRTWAYRRDHPMPDCSCGSREYKYEKVSEEYHLLCQRCKTRYERRHDEVSVFENGLMKPYKKLVKHQGWV